MDEQGGDVKNSTTVWRYADMSLGKGNAANGWLSHHGCCWCLAFDTNGPRSLAAL